MLLLDAGDASFLLARVINWLITSSLPLNGICFVTQMEMTSNSVVRKVGMTEHIVWRPAFLPSFRASSCVCARITVYISCFFQHQSQTFLLSILRFPYPDISIDTIIMKIYLALVACISLVAAIAVPQNDGEELAARSWSFPSENAGASCQPGYDYCYGQIIGDLSMCASSNPHNILKCVQRSIHKLYSISTATHNLSTTRSPAMHARSGLGLSIPVAVDRVHGNPSLRACPGISTHSKSGVIHVRQGNVQAGRLARRAKHRKGPRNQGRWREMKKGQLRLLMDAHPTGRLV